MLMVERLVDMRFIMHLLSPENGQFSSACPPTFSCEFFEKTFTTWLPDPEIVPRKIPGPKYFFGRIGQYAPLDLLQNRTEHGPKIFHRTQNRTEHEKWSVLSPLFLTLISEPSTFLTLITNFRSTSPLSTSPFVSTNLNTTNFIININLSLIYTIYAWDIMVVTDFGLYFTDWCWWLILLCLCQHLYLGDILRHQHRKVVTNWFRLQRPSPTLM